MEKIIEALKKQDQEIKVPVIILCIWFIAQTLLQKPIIISRNTISYWLLISLSLLLSKMYFNTYKYFLIIAICITLIHEYFYYINFIGITKDEGEVTINMYNWTNIYTPVHEKIVKENNDYSEAIFDNEWFISNEEAWKRKFDIYFKYLKLESGMKLLDIGCGNCQWINYCQSRGVICTGVTISESQKQVCEKNGVPNVILGDVIKNVLLTIKDKFDAISCIGPVEHFSSISQPPQTRLHQLNKFFTQVTSLIDRNSKSRRFLNSLMTSNSNYSNNYSLEYYANMYFIASAFGYGYYPSDEEITQIYNSYGSKVLFKRDYTEDYRWASARNKNSIGYINYNFNSLTNVGNFIKDVLTDPNWIHRLIYGYFNCWLWQFGGDNLKPMPENKDTPIRSYIYVCEITK